MKTKPENKKRIFLNFIGTMVKKQMIQQKKKESFGERLTRLRKARGLTQTELAKMIGVTQRVITYYERETPFPPSNILPPLSRALKTTTDHILGLEKYNGKTEGDISPQLARKLKSINRLPKTEQKALILFIEALEAKQKIEEGN